MPEHLKPGGGGQSLETLLRQAIGSGNVEHNLRRLDRLASIGLLSAGMAHEIKNALVAVRTFVDLLLEKNPDAELAQIVQREMGRMDGIVGRMLRFSTPAPAVCCAVRLHAVLDHSLRLVQSQVGSKLIAFNKQLDAPDDSINGNALELEQAFVNLLLNAIDAIGSDGTLTITTRLFKDGYHPAVPQASGTRLISVQIQDSGSGIPPENLQRIFEPFFTTKQSGTGLGLAVTRRIIDEHHGTITVTSKPGQGSTFAVILPSSAAS